MLPLRLVCPGLALLVGLTGCGGPPSGVATVAPHQGVIIPLPGAKGVAELVFEPLPRSQVTGRTAPTEVVIYLLAPDRTAPLVGPPTEVTLTLLDPEQRRKVDRKLLPRPRAEDPLGAARFASGPIDRDYSQIPVTGELATDINGPIRAPF